MSAISPELIVEDTKKKERIKLFGILAGGTLLYWFVIIYLPLKASQ